MTCMRLSARADYALRAAIELTAAGGDHVTAEQLAHAQHIPGKFLETILTHLRRSGLVRSQRGPDGGFWLARPANEISLADIIRAIDGQLLGVRGERPENVTYPGAAEPLQRVWIALRANERAVLETVTLQDIVSGRLPEAIRLLTDSPRAWLLRFSDDASDRHHIGDVAGRRQLAELAVHRVGPLPHLDRNPVDRDPVARDAQAGLARDTEGRLALQFGERKVVGNLAEHLRQWRLQSGTDGREQFGGRFLAAAFHLGEVTERHPGRRGHLAECAALPDAQAAQDVAEQLTKQYHRHTPFLRLSLPSFSRSIRGTTAATSTVPFRTVSPRDHHPVSSLPDVTL